MSQSRFVINSSKTESDKRALRLIWRSLQMVPVMDLEEVGVDRIRRVDRRRMVV